MDNVLVNLFFLLGRYLHIVCTTLLVGGTLFYEAVVPVAIGDLKTHEQLSVWGRARWMWRSIVWGSAVLLLVTGVISTVVHWPAYVQADRVAATMPTVSPDLSVAVRAGWWWAAHATSGLLAILLAVSLTIGRRPPERPVAWMRLNLIILLVVIFLGTATRQVRLFSQDRAGNGAVPVSTRGG
ncbi:MAG TPA: hypothetical protein VK324_07030 [Tepidisphaeraceae bacterium]|nr:hypothetical protein [Tepidisphaeraceae bacterium]